MYGTPLRVRRGGLAGATRFGQLGRTMRRWREQIAAWHQAQISTKAAAPDNRPYAMNAGVAGSDPSLTVSVGC